MPKKNKRKKLTLITTIVLSFGLLIAAGLYIFNVVSRDQFYSKPFNWSTYESESVPFTFDYPSSWSLDKETLNNQTTLTASNDNKNILSVTYDIQDWPNAEGASGVDPDCKNKQARSAKLEDACSYIVNNSMRKGYFYNNVGSADWRSDYIKTVANKEQLVSVTLSLIDNSSSSKNDLINLAKSIEPVVK